MKTFLIGILFSVMAMGQQIPVTTSQQQQLQNLIVNAGFENGKAGWVSSGGTFTVQTGTILMGAQSAAFTASSTSQYFQSSAYAVPVGLQGQDCVASISYTGGSSNLKLTIVDSSDAQVVPLANSTTLSATSSAKYAKLYFSCPSGSVKIRVVSSASSAIAYFDDMYVGKSDSVPVSQATIIASARWAPASSCEYTGNGSTVLSFWTEFTTGASCNNPTVSGFAEVPGTKVPRLKVSNLPPGKYMLVFNGIKMAQSGAGTGVFALTDGLSVGSARHDNNGTANATIYSNHMTAKFEYSTSQSSLEFRPVAQGTAGSWTGLLQNFEATQNETDFEMILIRYPSESESVVNSKCANDLACENIFTAKVSNSGVVSDENLDWLNGNCTNANPFVCTFNSSIFSSTPNCYAQAVTLSGSPRTTTIQAQSSSSVSVRTYADGTVSLQDYFNLICTKAPADFKLRQNIQAYLSEHVKTPGVAAPKLCSFFTSNGAGVETVCSSGTCNTQNIKGSCANSGSVTRSAQGQYIYTMVPGFWSSPSSINCTASSSVCGGSGGCIPRVSNSLDGTTRSIQFFDSANALQDSSFSVICHGE